METYRWKLYQYKRIILFQRHLYSFVVKRWRFNVNTKWKKKKSMAGRNAVLIKYCSRPIRLFNRNRSFETKNFHLLFHVHPRNVFVHRRKYTAYYYFIRKKHRRFAIDNPPSFFLRNFLRQINAWSKYVFCRFSVCVRKATCDRQTYGIELPQSQQWILVHPFDALPTSIKIPNCLPIRFSLD